MIGCFRGRHVWGGWAMSAEVAKTVEKEGSFAGELPPLIFGALTVWAIGLLDGLMGKVVEDRYPRIVLQVNSRARENNSNVYARGRLSFWCVSEQV